MNDLRLSPPIVQHRHCHLCHEPMKLVSLRAGGYGWQCMKIGCGGWAVA